MRLLLIALIAFLVLSTVFGFDPGPLPGVKVKNAVLYAIVLGLALRLTLDRRYRIQLPSVPILFSAMIGYALLTYLVIVLVINYPHYNALQAGFILKNSLFDQMMFFLVFFYGLRSDKDALVVLKVLLAAWALSHIVAVLDATGLMQVGDIEQRHDGRVQGAIGEANQYGAFVALSLPAMVALVAITRGMWRLFWMAVAIVTAAALVMTVSRGAFVATVLATTGGLWMFRRYLLSRKLAMWAVGAVIAAVVVGVVVMSLGFGDLLYARVVGQASSGDLGATSSGRTEIWAAILETMSRTPLTLLTGFGWESYSTMPFRFATHNHYLAQFFNLGVIGLGCTVLLFIVQIRTAKAALAYASEAVRPQLIAFATGTMALAVAVFFVNLYLPWLYYWAYAGIAMRLAVNALEGPARAPATVAVPPVRRAVGGRDPHGWTTAS
jgi:O-antigen ligase